MNDYIGTRMRGRLPSARVAAQVLCCTAAVALAVACGQDRRAAEPGDRATIDPPPATPAGGPESDLPVLSLEYRGETIRGSMNQACWQVEGEDGRTCSEADPWTGIDSYTEVAPNEQVHVLVESDTRPKGLFALMVTEPGEVHVDFKRMSTVRGVFELKHGPGDYKVRVTGNWEEGNVSVSYEFGLRIAGEPELTSECVSTAIGGDLDLVLHSLEDRMRTAIDAANSGGCRFNVPIAEVRLVLSEDVATVYTESFRIDPPSPRVPFPLREGIDSEQAGGPLPPGEYSRRIMVIATDGQELDLTAYGGFLLDTVTLLEMDMQP